MISMTAKKKNNFLVQGSVLAAASIIGRFIGLLYRIPMTNNIGVEGGGYYSISFEIYNIALIISSYSLPLAVSKLVAARTAKKEHKNAYRIFLCSMAFAIISGGTVALVVYFGADFFAALYKSPGASIPLKILSPTIFICAVMGVMRGFFQGKSTMLPTAFSQVLEQIVNAVVSVTASYWFMKQHSASENIAAFGAGGGTLGTCIGALSAFCFLLFIYIIYRPTLQKQRSRDKTAVKEGYRNILSLVIATMIPVILSQTVYQISGPVDNALFGQIMEKKDFSETVRISMIGAYSSQYKVLTNLPIAIASAYAASMVPSITSAKIINAISDIKLKIHLAIKLNMIIAIPSAVGMGVLAEPIIRLIFPSSELLAVRLLQTGSSAIVFFALSTISNAVLQGINRLRLPVIHSGISLVVHIILVYVLLKFFNFGIYGLIVGNITFALLICVLNWISIAKELNYKQEVLKTFVVPTVSSILMGVLSWLVYKGVITITHSNAAGTMAAIVAAVIAYSVFLLLFKGLSEEEILSLPKGRTILGAAKKLHLIR